MCSVCEGNSLQGRCPCCQPLREKTCKRCNGTGKIFYHEEFGEITKEQFNNFPEAETYSEQCDECFGEGVIQY